jgi:YD repeat-containing protein
MKTATDENNQTTSVTYDANNLRQTRVDRPDGGYTTYEYNDTLVQNPDSSHLVSFFLF